MKNIQILFFLFLSCGVFSQVKSNIDSLVSVATQEMNEKQIDNFFFWKTYCVGSSSITKKGDLPCLEDKTDVYLFWKDKEQSYVKKIDNCGFYEPLKINDKAMNFFEKHLDVIKQENVRRYAVKKDSIAGNKVWSFVKYVSHSCFVQFYLHDKTGLIIKKYDVYDLTTESKEKNIYFETNNSLNIVKLNAICHKLINNLQDKKKFQRMGS